MKNLVKIVLGIFLLTSGLSVHAQRGKNPEELLKEIKRLETALKSKQNRERTLLEQVDDLEKEINLRQKLLKEIGNQKQQKEKKIEKTKTNLENTTIEYNRLKKIVARRIVSMYKRGRIADWEVLLTLKSLSQARVWLKYQKRIVENDRRNLRLLAEKKNLIQTQKKRLEKEIKEKEKIIAEKKAESKKLEEKKKSREKLLTRVRQDKNFILEKLRSRRLAYKKIKSRISREEKRRKTFVATADAKEFEALKGKLPWPVKGKIISSYGRHKHPILKTWTENLGIDILTKSNGIVKAVSRGKVRWVTWQRGMGNLILLDHGGYYTVYGHLSEVLVTSGEEVAGGEAIGRVGDSKSLNGSTLHFEIWKGTTHYNPTTWLR